MVIATACRVDDHGPAYAPYMPSRVRYAGTRTTRAALDRIPGRQKLTA